MWVQPHKTFQADPYSGVSTLAFFSHYCSFRHCRANGTRFSYLLMSALFFFFFHKVSGVYLTFFFSSCFSRLQIVGRTCYLIKI